ncbi:hypothetical protein [Noviherbaspirillum galbum]|uniref:Uncharacterized protein n=1 Tax=Noviherbaspirillum galbum TaxID=2709383 RepID=A0A6B3SPR3_9BURK|nr:hypothetical protein [Noviherbaspirillum galbum]NEX62717.1 hypothetical protein [Noviherbaspirillum galbum]
MSSANRPYDAAAGEKLHARLMIAARRAGPHYDLVLAADRQLLAKGVVRLRSKNFGYEFALVQTSAGTGLFGKAKMRIRIYRSHLSGDRYTLVHTASGLSEAIRYVNRAYQEALRSHLP